MRRRRLEWFGLVKRREKTENIRAVAEMKRLSNRKTKVAVERHCQKPGTSGRNGSLTDKDNPHREKTAAKGEIEKACVTVGWSRILGHSQGKATG